MATPPTKLDESEVSERLRKLRGWTKEDGTIAAALCLGGWPPSAGEAYEQDLLRHLMPAADEFSRQYGQFEPW